MKPISILRVPPVPFKKIPRRESLQYNGTICSSIWMFLLIHLHYHLQAAQLHSRATQPLSVEADQTSSFDREEFQQIISWMSRKELEDSSSKYIVRVTLFRQVDWHRIKKKLSSCLSAKDSSHPQSQICVSDIWKSERDLIKVPVTTRSP